MTGVMEDAAVCGALVLGGYEGEAPPASFLDRIAHGHLAGAILFRRNLPSAEAGYAASQAIAAAAGSRTPPWVSLDQEGGRVRRLLSPVLQLPAMRVLAAPGDADLVERAARTLANQLLALGFNLNFAPVLDVDTNPANPVIGDRSFGRDATLVARLGWAFARGLQSEGVAACGKHFPGHGDTSVDSHLDLPRVDTTLQRMREVELVPFREVIRLGIDAIMSAHIVCTQIAPGVPATLAPALMTGLLRDELGFSGVVFSDDLEMRAISGRTRFGEAAVRAVRAGCDVVCICRSEDGQREAHEALVRECERDLAFRARCARAAERVVKLRLARPPRPAATCAEALAVCTDRSASELAQEIESRCKAPATD